MDPESIKLLATAGAIAIGTIAPAIAIGRLAAKGLEAIGRNPEAAQNPDRHDTRHRFCRGDCDLRARGSADY